MGGRDDQRSLPGDARLAACVSVSATETPHDLRGTYEPPGGLLGSAADILVGHRIAEASVHRFLDEVASRLSQELVPGVR